jgi:hypothetical protein
MVLFQLAQREPDRIAVDRELRGHTVRDRELEPREEVGGDELVRPTRFIACTSCDVPAL